MAGKCGDCEKKKLAGGSLQTKLTVNEPGDIYEQEADRVAEQVMRMSAPMGTVSHHAAPTISRMASGIGGGAEAPSIVHDVLGSSGQPLDAGTRASMEPRFGHDFSHVRIHTDAKAAESARVVNALAYTVGNNVVFGEGQYAPGSGGGQRLLAHELVHVVQQGDRRTDTGCGPMSHSVTERIIQRIVSRGATEPPDGTGTSYVEDTELITCMQLYGKGSRDYCLEQIGQNPTPTGCIRGGQRTLALQPVFFRNSDTDASPTGASWSGRLNKSNEIWGKLGVKFTEASAIILTDPVNKTGGSTPTERDGIRALQNVSGVEVFVVDNDLTGPGGAATIRGCDAIGKVVMSDRGTSDTLLAHELGHVMGLPHPPSSDPQGADTIMEPTGSHSVANPIRNTMYNYHQIVCPPPSGSICLHPDI